MTDLTIENLLTEEDRFCVEDALKNGYVTIYEVGSSQAADLVACTPHQCCASQCRCNA